MIDFVHFPVTDIGIASICVELLIGITMEESEISKPHYMHGNKAAKSGNFYLNGNKHFGGKKVLINQKSHKTWDSILDHITQSLNPSFGAVRALYTPAHGHRLHHIEDMQPGSNYVAGGYGGFKYIP